MTSKRAQSVIEYTILFAIVVAGLVVTAFITKGKNVFQRHFESCNSEMSKSS